MYKKVTMHAFPIQMQEVSVLFTILQYLPENFFRTIVWWTLHAFMHWMCKIIVHQVLGGEETSVNSNLILGKEKKSLSSIQFTFVYISAHHQDSNVPCT